MLVLDTNVVSELRKIEAGRADATFAQWAAATDLVDCYLSVVTVHELEYGVLLVERRDPVQGTTLRKWLDEGIIRTFADRLLPLTLEAATLAAEYQAARPAPVRDAFIAATAATTGMTVITRNLPDFERYPQLAVHNPWLES
jgi:predicted nucleic acid-binding protein